MNQYEIYYDPVGANYQRPSDWAAIWIGTSDNFEAGINSTRWTFDNTTGSGNSTWLNQSGNGVMRIGSGSDPNDGCFRSADSATAGNNITQTNARIEFLFNKRTSWQVLTGNSAMGLDDRSCGVSPNTNGFGVIIKDNLAGDRLGIAMRTLDQDGFVSLASKELNRPPVGTWTLLATNWTGNTRSGGFSGTAINNASSYDQQTSFVPDNFRATRVLMRYEGGSEDVVDIDEVRVYQIVNSSPAYTIFQENRTIVSPETLLNAKLNVQACTAENRTNTSNTYNGACIGAYPAACGSASSNDFLSCDDGNTERQNFQANRFAGVHEQSFNESANDCKITREVFLCYEWWVSGGTLTNCLIAVDADGNASYSNVTTTCPGTTPNPGITCTNVTALENWTCSNFFDTSGTKAVARNELSRSSTGPMSILSTDVLFFNVTYVESVPPTVNLINPPNNTNNRSNIHKFIANITDNVGLKNATLYHNISGNFIADQTINFIGANNQTNFTISFIPDGGYIWNVLACDNSNNCGRSSVNFTFTVNNPPRNISLINPSDGTSNISSNQVFFSNATDDRQLANATLYHNISGSFVANQTANKNGTFNTSSFTVANIPIGNYLWNVQWCDTDGGCAFAINNFTFRVKNFTNAGPTITGVDINSTDSTTNNTDQNITIYPRNVTDADGDLVTNITNWFKNGASLTILNLAFDTNITSSTNESFNIRDYSGQSLNATNSNISWVAGGLNGGAYKFVRNSTTESKFTYIHIPETNDLKLNSSFAIESWFNYAAPVPAGKQLVIVGKRSTFGGNGWKLSIENGDNRPLLFTQRRNGTDFTVEKILSVNPGPGPGPGEWVHAVVNWNGSNLTLWVNGVPWATTTMKGNLTNADIADHNITIGNYNNANGLFNGTIDTVRIYNTSLSDEQIRLLNSSRGDWLTIVSQETGLTGENWSACVTPNDATTDGTTVCSENLTIG